MTDYRSMYDRDYIGAWDLPPSRDVVVTIERIEAKTLNNGKSQNTKPVIYFNGKEKGFVCNKTNGKAIAGMYGTKVAEWVGKRIALYVTMTSLGGEQIECIRVRPTIPKEAP